MSLLDKIQRAYRLGGWRSVLASTFEKLTGFQKRRERKLFAAMHAQVQANGGKVLCDYPWTRFEVNHPTGDVNPCCMSWAKLGNVNENTISEIWNGPGYQEFRRKMLRGDIREYCPTNCPVLCGHKPFDRPPRLELWPETHPVRMNAEKNMAEMNQGALVLESRPRIIRYIASLKCNLACFHCFQRDERKVGGRLPETFFLELERLFPTLQMLFLFGGEPFCEEVNLRMLEKVAQLEKGPGISFVSNGTLFGDRLKKLLEAVPLHSAALSVESFDPVLYREFRRGAEIESFLSALDFLAALRTKKEFLFLVTMTLCQLNIEEVPAFIRRVLALGGLPCFQGVADPGWGEADRTRYALQSAETKAALRRVLDKTLADETLGLPEFTRKQLLSLYALC